MNSLASRFHRTGGPALALVYAAIAVIMTWPLMRHPATHIASDLGDPLFICWVLAWTGGQVIAALRGDLGALANYWNGNIFAPERLTVAYSEHFTPQMLQMLPVYAAGGNILLCYNLLFLSTFVVAALGMYLFVRDLTCRPLAAFLAGLAFAYAPYRLGQFPHLQILSIGWMPLALLGLWRFFRTDRVSPLAWGTVALVVQGLSCGYYLLFFSPLFGAFALHEMTRRRLLGNRRVWMRIGLAAVSAAVVLWPFLRPYAALKSTGAIGPRSLDDAAMFAADTHAFATIAPNARLLASTLTGYPKPEGEGFPGFTIVAFVAAGLTIAAFQTARRIHWASMPLWQLVLWTALAAKFVFSVVVVLVVFVDGRLTLSGASSVFTMQDVTPWLWIAAIAGLVLVAFTRHLAGPARGETAPMFWIATAAAAALLAFGPNIYATGHLVGHGPYAWLFAHVPGFDGLRVPARFLTIVTLALAVLAGLGAASLIDAFDQPGRAIVALGACTLILESWIAPISLDQRVIPDTLLAPGVPVVGGNISTIYRTIKDLPDPVVLVEFPFGEPAYDIQATFYAGYHRRPLVNGYSGFFPAGYGDRAAVLSAAPADPDAVRHTLADSHATHVVVHEAAFPDGRGRAIVNWLVTLGARPMATAGMDTLLALPADLGGG